MPGLPIRSLVAEDRSARGVRDQTVWLSYTDIDLSIRGRAIGLLARVLYLDLSC